MRKTSQYGKKEFFISFLGFTPFSPKIIGKEKFGVPSKRTRPRENELEQKAWDHFKESVESEIQIIFNVCQCKLFFGS